MNVSWIGWGCAVVAIALGHVVFGWRGVVLALSVTVFWLLLEFSRSLRALRRAAGRPLGHVDNAVMLHARLARGLHLSRVLGLTQSLGRKVADDPETYAWADGQDDEVSVVLNKGRVASWELRRSADRAGPQVGA